jgi:hypothetical protein
MKGYYASEIVYVAAIGFAKLSILVLFYNIVVTQRIVRRAVTSFGVVVLAWTVASVIAIAFQCGLPRPWGISGSRCFNLVSGIYCDVNKARGLIKVANLLDRLLHN